MASFSLKKELKSKFGLIVTPSAAARTAAKQDKKPSIFQDDDDEDTNTGPQPPSRRPNLYNPPRLDTSSGQQQRVKEMHEEALQEDSSIFDYDGVYDQMKHAKEQEKLARYGITSSKQARYIHRMKQEAAERARQEIRIQDRKIHRELQQELSENPDMLDKAEIFVTEAYKRQQEEIKRLDEEERQALEKDGQGDVTKKKSFAGFFKNILDDRERTAAAVQNELKSGRAKGQLMDTETTGTSSSTAGKPLGAGLNVLKRPADYVLGKRTSSGADSSGVGKGSQHRLDRKERERMAHEFEKQLLEKQMEDERKRQEEEEELRQKWARQTNEDSAAEARRRFEERRKARLAEAKDVNTET